MITRRGAILMRMGKTLRRDETRLHEAYFRREDPDLGRIEPPAPSKPVMSSGSMSKRLRRAVDSAPTRRGSSNSRRCLKAPTSVSSVTIFLRTAVRSAACT
jgi:hypothetical protein